MEDLVTCPYNKFHQIRRARIQYHIQKCRKNFPEMDLAVCPYNATHHFPKSEERIHLLECRDRRVVEMQKYNEPLPGRHGYLANPPFYGSSLLESDQKNEELENANESRGVSMNESSISTHVRHQDLRARVNPRRNQSPFSRRSSVDGVGIVPSNLIQLVPSTSDHLQGYPAVEIAPPPPLRTPIVHGGPPPVRSRRTSPADVASSLYPSSSRKTSPSPSRRSGMPTALTKEGGRLVPRKRSSSPLTSTNYQSYN